MVIFTSYFWFVYSLFFEFAPVVCVWGLNCIWLFLSSFCDLWGQRCFPYFLVLLDHKSIGLLYVLFGVLFGFVGVYLSGLISVELLVPGHYLFSGSENTYNMTVTTHGIIMIFFAAMPIFISGFGNYFVPFMVGCSDLAMPSLNMVSFVLFIVSFLFLMLSMGVFGDYFEGVASGWTLYPPLSVSTSNPSLDFLIISLHLNGLSSLLNAFNTIVTIQYCSALCIWHLSLFVWSILITSYLIILVVPVLVVGVTTLLTDHVLGTCFYSVLGGGDPVLFQHLFWFFGHPEVYILILPAFGLVSEIVSEYCSYNLLGYNVMIWSMVSIAVLGCIVWGHHMYTVGMDTDTKCYFTLATSLIAVPTGLKILLWIASILNSPLKFNVPFSFSLLFIFTFTFGGLTGVWLAQAGLDLMLHDTYFVVAHFHYVLAASLVYMFFAAFYNWFYLVTGIYYDEFCASVHLITFFIGVNLLFLPMHVLGISGMPSSVFDYPTCFSYWNELCTLGFFMVFISLFWFAASMFPLFLYTFNLLLSNFYTFYYFLVIFNFPDIFSFHSAYEAGNGLQGKKNNGSGIFNA